LLAAPHPIVVVCLSHPFFQVYIAVQYFIPWDPIDGSHLGFDNGRHPKMFWIAPSFSLTPKPRDSHQIHHHISLGRKIMDKNGCLMAAIFECARWRPKSFR